MPPQEAQGRSPSALTRKVGDSGHVAKKMLQGSGTYATTIFVWCCDVFAREAHHYDKGAEEDNSALAWLKWHPTVIMESVEEKVGCKLPKANFDKLMAAVSIVTDDAFFKDAAKFIQLANVLAGDDFQPDEFNPADVAECAWAVTEALLLRPPDEEDPEVFSDEVRRYIGFVLKEEGYVKAPDVLRIALEADFSPEVNEAFAGDPEMFQGIYQNQTAKTAEVEDIVRQGLTNLMGQLKALPLQEGSTAELEKRLSSVQQGA
jgi:hypothetical protein